jgi:hypothetical protein
VRELPELGACEGPRTTVHMISMIIRPKVKDSVVDPAFVALSELFAGPLRSVSFPGVDAPTITQLVEETQRRALTVDDARAALAAAEGALATAESAFIEQHATLSTKSHLAIAYARVFAKHDPELLAKLDRITLPKLRAPSAAPASSAAPSTPPRRRGRPPKASVTTAPGATTRAEAVAAE